MVQPLDRVRAPLVRPGAHECHPARRFAGGHLGHLVVQDRGDNRDRSAQVTLTSPAAGSTFNAPANLTVAASATDADGTIVSVEFFNGSTSIGRSTTAPYRVSWQNVPAGTYTLSDVATDTPPGRS